MTQEELDEAFFFVRSTCGPDRLSDEECWAIVEKSRAEVEDS